MIVDLFFHDANMVNGNEHIAPLLGALVLHCQALCDGVSLEANALGLSDKRSALAAMGRCDDEELRTRSRSAWKRKVESLDLLEAHSDEHLNGDELDTSVHRQPTTLSRILFRFREAKSPHFKNSLAEPKQAELVSAKGVCE